jgi:RNA polymerase sigma-70 factor (ECF subfamily)
MRTSSDCVQTSERTKEALSPDFRNLFNAEFDYVCRSLRRLGVHEADLKDVAQELFVAVHGRMGDYDGTRQIRPWLFSFAVRYASNYRRLGRNRNHGAHDESIRPTEHRPELEARDLVLRALGCLNFDRQTIVIMHDMEGFDAPEIAAQLGIPVNTVYSRIRLARANFREAVDHLQKKGGTP